MKTITIFLLFIALSLKSFGQSYEVRQLTDDFQHVDVWTDWMNLSAVMLDGQLRGLMYRVKLCKVVSASSGRELDPSDFEIVNTSNRIYTGKVLMKVLRGNGKRPVGEMEFIYTDQISLKPRETYKGWHFMHEILGIHFEDITGKKGQAGGYAMGVRG